MSAIDLLVTSGDGPVECRIALMRLLDILEREAKAAGCEAAVTLGSQPDRHGPGSAIISVEGEGAAALARGWQGTVKFIFESPVRRGHKRKNWFVGVQIIDLAREVGSSVRAEDVRFETLRAGGPGGQHQNTTDSAVRAVHLPTGIMVMARDERSQHRNKALALARLAAMLRALDDRQMEAAKTRTFLANKSLERGNEVRVVRFEAGSQEGF